MSLWNTLMGWLRSGPDMDSTESGGLGCGLSDDHGCDINPATGLPMVGGCGGVDIEGNPYGTDSHHDDSWTSASTDWDDGFANSSWDSSIGNSWDD
jgi:hypothetical protein